MVDFPNIPRGLSAEQIKRIGRRDIYPASVKGSTLPQDLIKNSSVSTGSFSFNDGVVITLTVRTTSDLSPDTRMATAPFMVALFDSDTFGGISPGTNQIPWDTTTGNFDLYGPVAMPDFTVNGERFYLSSGSSIYFATNGNDVVYKTGIRNSSSGSQTVQYLIQTRIIQSRGGAGSLS